MTALTPRLMLAAWKTATRLASARSDAFWSASRPVVPQTSGTPVDAHAPACATEATGAEKSMSTSIAVSRSLTSSKRGIPFGPGSASRTRRLNPPTTATRESFAARAAISRPMRPRMPAIPMLTVMAMLLDRGCGAGSKCSPAAVDVSGRDRGDRHRLPRLQRDFYPSLCCLAQRRQRQPYLRRAESQERRGGLHRRRVRLHEHRPAEIEECQVHGTPAREIARQASGGERGDRLGNDVGNDRDNPRTPDTDNRQCERVVSRKNDEVLVCLAHDLARLIQRPARLLDTDDSGKIRQSHRRFREQINTGSTGHVVENDWQVDRLRNRGEMPIQP